jgi:hypothetical protein
MGMTTDKKPDITLESLDRRFNMYERTQRGMAERIINKELVDLPFRIFEQGITLASADKLVVPNQTRQQTRVTSILVLLDALAIGAACLQLDDQTSIPLNTTASDYIFNLNDIDFIVKGQNRTLTWPSNASTATYGLYICGWAIPSQMKELS